jgi:rhamnosyl/mannosyltransferase
MEAHVQTLARAQAKLGLSVQVICVNHEPGPTKREQDGEVGVIRLSRLGSAAKLDICPDLFGLLAATDAEIFHVHVPNPIMIIGALAARREQLVVTYHSDHVRQRLRGLVFGPIERRFFGRVKAILATSEAYSGSSPLLRRFAEKVETVPLGIDLEPFLRPDPRVLLEAKEIQSRYAAPIWFSCGRIVYYKGLQTALDALEHVEGTLLVAGEGPELERLRSRATPRAVFLGDVEDVRPYYLAARALWFPSNARSEAFGLVQVEAMASGCPVINVAIGGSGVPWVSPHEETGITIPRSDPGQLAGAARRLLDDELRERLGCRGRERARKLFDHGVMAERTHAVYQRVLEAAVAT